MMHGQKNISFKMFISGSACLELCIDLTSCSL